MAHLDLLTRKWWRLVGREIDLSGEQFWLDAPTVRGSLVADSWLAEEAARYGGVVHEATPGAGLMATMAALDGPGFAADDLAPQVRDFLDLFVFPDGSWVWKDRDDFERAVGDGVLEPHLPALFETEAQRVLIEHAAGQGAFDRTWIDWRPPWRLPLSQLPAPFRPGGSRW